MAFAVAFAIALPVVPIRADDHVSFTVAGEDDSLAKDLRAASLLIATQAEKDVDALALFSAARGEYAQLLGALYAHGHYSAVISVLVDGREAASIAPLDAPDRIGRIEVRVDPGPPFAFSQARVAPLAQGTELPEGFAVGERAESDLIRSAVTAGVDGWRDTGHAKARPGTQNLSADHARATLAADVELVPGPRLRFGPLAITGQDRMREARIREIAGLPEGEVFSPEELDRAANRLRRTGVFRSVTLTEEEGIIAPDLLPITATVVEERRRRYSFGAELASLDGLKVTGYWLHRNLFGGAERLKIEGEIANIGANDNGVDYILGVTLDRPATFTPDTTVGIGLTLAHLDEPDYAQDLGEAAVNVSHIFSDSLTGRVSLTYQYAEGEDPGGSFRYRNLALPIGLTWDRRDSKVDATRGFYIDAEAKPFLGFGTTDSGLRMTLDARAYRGFGDENRVVLAGRLQLGAIYDARLLAAPRADLFYSGGAGTVRGQPYQSLGVPVLRGFGEQFKTGGTYFAAASAEVRTRITERIGVVGFVDAGQVTVGDFNGPGDWHAGAGLGVRYATGFGPIRLDIAAPIGGDTGDGVQFYLGIGQAF